MDKPYVELHQDEAQNLYTCAKNRHFPKGKRILPNLLWLGGRIFDAVATLHKRLDEIEERLQ